MAGITLRQYLDLLGTQIDAAEAREDVAECVRLAGVAKEALDEYVLKCKTAYPDTAWKE